MQCKLASLFQALLLLLLLISLLLFFIKSSLCQHILVLALSMNATNNSNLKADTIKIQFFAELPHSHILKTSLGKCKNFSYCKYKINIISEKI